MTLINLALASILLNPALIQSQSPGGPETYTIDGSHSFVTFRVKHMNVSYAYGRFNDISGEFTFDSAKPEAGSVNVTIKADSVDTNQPKRDQHLKSPDFFDAKQFPKITFKSTSIRKSSENEYELTGDLTLHGVTKSITTRLERVGTGKDPRGGTMTGFEAVFSVNRSDYGINFMPGGLGEEVRIMVAIEGGRK